MGKGGKGAVAPRTAEVMADKAGSGVVVVPGEIVDAVLPQDKPLSLIALKLLHVLLDRAGGRVTEAVEHHVAMADLNGGHHRGAAELVAAVRELQRTIIELEEDRDGRRVAVSGQVLTDCARDMEADGRGILAYRLSETMRRVIRNSSHWAAVSARAVLAMESRYAVRLYQWVALRVHRRQAVEVVTLDDLRAVLGVSAGAYGRWVDLDRYVVSRAAAEVTQLTGIDVHAEPVIDRRRVVAVRWTWALKDRASMGEAARELERPKVGRRARREGQVEAVVADQRAMRAELLDDLRRVGRSE